MTIDRKSTIYFLFFLQSLTSMIQGKGHFLISSRRGLGTSLLIIRLATIDPQSQKEHSEIYKIPSGLVLTEIQSFKYVKIMKPYRSVWMAIHFFVNFIVFKWLYLA